MNNAGVLDVLALAHAFVDAGWCKGETAYTARGYHVGPQHDGAELFCAVGALDRAAYELQSSPQAEDAATDLLYDALPRGYRNVPAYNDGERRRKRDILRLYERAAAKVGK